MTFTRKVQWLLANGLQHDTIDTTVVKAIVNDPQVPSHHKGVVYAMQSLPSDTAVRKVRASVTSQAVKASAPREASRSRLEIIEVEALMRYFIHMFEERCGCQPSRLIDYRFYDYIILYYTLLCYIKYYLQYDIIYILFIQWLGYGKTTKWLGFVQLCRALQNLPFECDYAEWTMGLYRVYPIFRQLM